MIQKYDKYYKLIYLFRPYENAIIEPVLPLSCFNIAVNVNSAECLIDSAVRWYPDVGINNFLSFAKMQIKKERKKN